MWYPVAVGCFLVFWVGWFLDSIVWFFLVLECVSCVRLKSAGTIREWGGLVWL